MFIQKGAFKTNYPNVSLYKLIALACLVNCTIAKYLNVMIEMLTVVKVGHKSIDHERERERENNSDESFLCLTSFYVPPTPVLLIL